MQCASARSLQGHAGGPVQKKPRGSKGAGELLSAPLSAQLRMGQAPGASMCTLFRLAVLSGEAVLQIRPAFEAGGGVAYNWQGNSVY